MTNNSEQMLTAIATFVGSVIALAVLFFRRRRSHASNCNERHVPQWHASLIGAAVVMAYCYGMRSTNGEFPFVLATVSVLLFIRVARHVFRERPQFSLRSLFILTSGVAAMCSLSFYVPIAPIIVAVGTPTVTWLHLRQP